MRATDLTPINSTICQWIRSNAEAHALGALDPVEADRAEQHLVGCADCDRFISNLLEMTPLIGLVVPSINPAEGAKARLFAAVRSESRTAARVNGEPADSSAIPVTTTRRFAPNGFRPGHAAVSVLSLLLLMGAFTLGSQRSRESQRSRVTQLERENAAMALQISSIKAGEVAFGENAHAYQLTNVNSESIDAGGIMFGDPSQSTAFLSVWNMPGDEPSYHVMCESERGEMLAAGELLVNDRGVGTIQLNLPATVAEYRAVHILPGSGGGPNFADIPTNDILLVLLIDPTAVPINED